MDCFSSCGSGFSSDEHFIAVLYFVVGEEWEKKNLKNKTNHPQIF